MNIRYIEENVESIVGFKPEYEDTHRYSNLNSPFVIMPGSIVSSANAIYALDTGCCYYHFECQGMGEYMAVMKTEKVPHYYREKFYT